MSKKSKQQLVGQCPHCKGTFELPQEWIDRVAEASLEAVNRAVEREEKRHEGRYVTIHLGPSAST